jgi:hypothetical protein
MEIIGCALAEATGGPELSQKDKPGGNSKFQTPNLKKVPAPEIQYPKA